MIGFGSSVAAPFEAIVRMRFSLCSLRVVIDHNTGHRVTFRFRDQISVRHHEPC
jgi:hypothetical protein